MEITNTIITYSDNINIQKTFDDRYGIASYLNKSRINTFLNNPNLKDYSKCVMYLSVVDNIAVGRIMYFPIEFKNNETISEALSGSALEVHHDYRHLAVGADIMVYPLLNKENKFIIYSGISEQALPMYKKLKYMILEFPRMMLIRNSRCMLESFGLKGRLLKLLSTIVNFPLRFATKIGCLSSKNKSNKFTVEKVNNIPDWVDEVTLNDGHKYAEVHDKKWFQWNLDYNFRRLQEDIQSFYIIKNGDEPIGFFMLKERFRELAGGKLKNVTIGSIVEWGTKDEKILNETDINTIALTKFSKNIDIIEFASTDCKTIKSMKKYGFLHHGFAHIVFKDLTKQCKDATDISLWRIRYGYADVILT